jgi:capsular polysaccharide transport system permease protein
VPERSAIPKGKQKPAGFTPATLLFVLLVLLPTAVSTLYYFVLASDRYAVETHFIVRTAKGSDTGGLSSLFRTFGIQRAEDESYAVIDFILSRDAVRAIDQEHPLRQIFTNSKADWLAKYPCWWTFWRKDDFEALYDYYSNKVEAWYEDKGGIITLRAIAFSPEDARLLSRLLLRQSEQLINRMNERAKQDAISYAQKELGRAQTMVVDAHRKITEFRNSELILDPLSDSEKTLSLVAQLTGERAELQRQLAEVTQNSPSSPGVPGLKVRITALEEQVLNERSKIVGDDNSLAQKVAAYERLTLDRQFADQNLTAAFQTLEVAEQDAWRQQIYIETTVSPSLPDEATEPRSSRNVVAVFIIGFFLFGMVWLVMAASKEHAG